MMATMSFILDSLGEEDGSDQVPSFNPEPTATGSLHRRRRLRVKRSRLHADADVGVSHAVAEEAFHAGLHRLGVAAAEAEAVALDGGHVWIDRFEVGGRG